MTLSFAHIVWIVVLMLSSFFAGWLLRRLRALEREAELDAALRDVQQRVAEAEADRTDRQQHLALLKRNLETEAAATAALEASLRRNAAQLAAARQALLDARANGVTASNSAPGSNGKLPGDPEATAAASNLNEAPGDTPGAQASITETLKQALGERDRRLLHLEVELARRDGAVGDLDRRLNEERSRAEAYVHTIGERDTALAALTEEIEKWRVRVPKLAESLKARDATLTERQHTIDALNGTLTELRHERDTSRTAVSESTERNRELLEQLEAAQNELDSVRTALMADNVMLATRTEAMVRDREKLGAEVGALQKERDDLVRAFEETRLQLATREQTNSELEAQLEAITVERSALSRQLEAQQRASSEEREKFTATLATTQTEHGALLRQKDREIAVLEGHARQTQLLHVQLDGAERALGELQTRFDALAKQQAGLVSQQSTWTREREDLSATLAAMQAERGGYALQLAAFERRAREDADTRAAETTRLHEQIETTAALEQKLQELKTRSSPLEELLTQRDAELAERAHRIEALQTQLNKLDATLGERAARIAALERDAASAAKPEEADPRGEYLEKRLIGQIEKNHELTRAITERDKIIATFTRNKALHDKSLAVLMQQVQDSRLENERLAARLSGDGSSSAGQTPDESPPRANVAEPGMTEPAPQESASNEEPDDGWQRAPDADNLQAIRGIGRSFERRLNELGVTRLSQIVTLAEEDIDWLERELDTFKGRIERDDWVGQAAALIAETGELDRPLPPIRETQHSIRV